MKVSSTCNSVYFLISFFGIECSFNVHKMCLKNTIITCDQWKSRKNQSQYSSSFMHILYAHPLCGFALDMHMYMYMYCTCMQLNFAIYMYS